MMWRVAEVLVRDETMTGREIESWVLPGLPDEITARELVRLRVREEVARFNASGSGVFRGLVRPSRSSSAGAAAAGAAAAGAASGGASSGRIDWEAQAEVACAAFAGNGFVMIVGERQVEDLDEVIDLRWTPSVAFIRLVPLVGG
jgi:hypothetical protein